MIRVRRKDMPMAPSNQTDTSQINVPKLRKQVLIITGIFVALVLLIWFLGAMPVTPNLSNPYSMTEWPTMEAQQRNQLTTYQIIYIDPETGEQVDPNTTDIQPEVRYAIPVDQAKDVVLQQGLPVRQEAAPAE